MIHAKLLEFQKKGITLEKDSINPHFRSQYVSLNEVLAKVKAPLNELGIVIEQTPEENGLRTRLLDTTSEVLGVSAAAAGHIEGRDFVECFVPFIGATDMQKLGGAITYARRYSLIAMLGLEDEDDDATVVTAKAPVRAATRPTSPVERNDEPFPSKDTTPAPAVPTEAVTTEELDSIVWEDDENKK
jgi:hypothetical protein